MKKPPYINHKSRNYKLLLSAYLLSILFGTGFKVSLAKEYHIWEKIEITLRAQNEYKNPYTETVVWIDLKGPDFYKRCYGFWDGAKEFRVRILATVPGKWEWKSGSNQSDPGLNGQQGEFTAIRWSQHEKEKNPCRRGMLRPNSNGHTFEYADGTTFFLLGDTWWPTATYRFPWYEDDKKRPIGPKTGFKDYVRFRKNQGFNCIALVAGFPNWANDDKPGELETKDGIEIRGAWQQPGTNSAKDMYDEEGNRPFLFPGKVPGYENYFPDINRINPEYFQNLDKKIDYLNSQGFVPFIEVARRDIGPAWKEFYKWPESYTRYIQYVWSRYQANICFFSPIHFDWDGSLPAEYWNEAANKVIDTYGHPPFGTLVSCNPTGTSLENFGHVDKAKWISFHQIGNFHHRFGHGHRSYHLLTDIYHTKPVIPAINGEPYYDGQHETEPGSRIAAMYCRSAMYGSVLSGGLGGHIYGSGKEGYQGGAMWGGNVEKEAKNKIWDGIKWLSGKQMQYLRKFILSEGKQYQKLVPKNDLLEPNKSGSQNDWMQWAYCARTPDKELFLIYFEKGCEQSELSGVIPNRKYKSIWYNPRNGRWNQQIILTTGKNRKVQLPEFPGSLSKSEIDWGMKLILADG